MYYYIFNPAANAGRAKKLKDKIFKTLNDYEIAGEFLETLKPGDGYNLAKEAKENGIKTVVVIGGDGTVNEIAQNLINTDIALGIIPTGENNIFAKLLGIENWKKAIEILLPRKLKEINVGKVKTENNERYFCAYLKIEKTQKSPTIWQKLSKEIPRTPFELHVEIEEKLEANTLTDLVIINNPAIESDSFNIFISNQGNVPTKLSFKNIKIRTKKSIPTIIDGENFGFTPLEIELIPKGLKVIVPREIF